jgi:hypothetical protein
MAHMGVSGDIIRIVEIDEVEMPGLGVNEDGRGKQGQTNPKAEAPSALHHDRSVAPLYTMLPKRRGRMFRGRALEG